MIKWFDAYTINKTTLQALKNDFGKDGICHTQGKVVYQDKKYTVLEQNKCPSFNTYDYFVIPTSLIYGKRKK